MYVCKLIKKSKFKLFKKKKALKDLANFDGFEDEDLDQKVEFIRTLPREKINNLCEIFGVDIYGSRLDQAERIVEFLKSPEDYYLPIF